MRIKYLEYEGSRRKKKKKKLSSLHQRATLSLLAVEEEMCNLTEVNVVVYFLISRCPSLVCQNVYTVPALKCVNVEVLIGLFARYNVPLALQELECYDQNCHIAYIT